MTPKQLMIQDGAPAALFMTPVQRTKAWAGRSLTTVPLLQAMPKNEDAATLAFRSQEDERRRFKSLNEINKMKARMMTKTVNHDLMRWDPRTCRFVEDTGAKPIENATDNRSGSASGNAASHKSPSRAAVVRDASSATVRVGTPQTAATIKAKPVIEGEWSRVTKDTARALAELNGVWDAKYDKLSGGLLVMTVTNRLKGLVKKGGAVKWQ